MLCLYSLHVSEVKTALPLRVYKALSKQQQSHLGWAGITRSEILWTLSHRGDSDSGLESAFYTTSKVKSRTLDPRKRDGMERRGWLEAGKKKG